MSGYVVTVRGPIPPDLGRKLAEAHAAAIRGRAVRTGGCLSLIAPTARGT